MLRALLIYLSQAAWARAVVTRWSLTWRVASRFVAGESPDDAIEAIKQLNEKGICATLDHLGENITSEEDALSATQEILHILDVIENTGVRAGVSIKLSQIGLLLGEEICEHNLRLIMERAMLHNNFVRIDMEDSPVTDVTLRLMRAMRRDGYAKHTGIVIQSYLYRSEDDVRQLMNEGTSVRICKGAYKEPPEIAYPKKADVDSNFDRITKIMLDQVKENQIVGDTTCGRFPPIPAIASHDDARILYAKNYADELDLPKRALEFQMLYGIRRDWQIALAEDDYPVRVY
ncbi:MAG: proline dehydrogenase family protein, partial [Chloroflexota bacterium]